MLTTMKTLTRNLLLAVLLLGVVSTAHATPSTPSTEPTTVTHALTVPEEESFSLDGVLIVAGIVAVVVVLAWLSSRIGDNRSHVIS
jgi:hypothetical protein